MEQKQKQMNEKKKMGRPKGKNKPKNADCLLRVQLSPRAKAAFEYIRLCYRAEAYDVEVHGEMPNSLPLKRNAEVVDRIIFDAAIRQSDPDRLLRYLRDKGCLNADELLPEGLDK